MRKYRGTALDIFGRSEERRRERALIAEYEQVVDEILARLTPQNHATAVELASVPEHIRGYGHVKEAHLRTAKTREAALLEVLRTPSAPAKPAVVKVVV
jgi:indolepyruvate ferredoxin oxidoreductase